MILLIAIIVAFIALIVFLVLSAKKTHWMNLVGIFFVFAFAVFYVLMAGVVLETNQKWKEIAEKNQQKLEKFRETLEVELTGSRKDVEWPHDSLKGLETEAAKQVLGQGRVWRQCKPGAFTGGSPNDLTSGSLTITLPPGSPAFRAKNTDPAAGGDDAVDGTSLVYVFLEIPDPANPGNYKISNYIGSFFASEPSDDNTTVKLSPSLVLPDPSNAAQIKQLNPAYKTARELVQGAGTDDNARWAMYDILPIDSYDVFVESMRAEAGDPKLEVTPDELRKKLVEEYMTIDMLRLQGNPDKYKEIIDSIVYTNQPESVYKEAGFDPGDEEKWYRIKFNRAFKGRNELFKVDFNGGDGEFALEDQAFDRGGLALLEILKLGEDVKFDKDQTVLLDHVSWEKKPVGFLQTMKENGDAVVSEVIYRRKLNDFDYDFRALVQFNKSLTSDRDHAAAKLTQLQTIYTAYEKQNATRREERDRINQDVKNYTTDKEAIEQYRQQLETQLSQARAEIDRYFRLTKELAARKQALEEKLLNQIEENTRKAEAAAGDAQ